MSNSGEEDAIRAMARAILSQYKRDPDTPAVVVPDRPALGPGWAIRLVDGGKEYDVTAAQLEEFLRDHPEAKPVKKHE